MCANCSRSYENDAEADLGSRPPPRWGESWSLVVVAATVSGVLFTSTAVAGVVLVAAAGAGVVITAAVVHCVVVGVERRRRAGAARVVRVLGLVAGAAQIFAGLVFPAP
jgi:hypothetical protein